MSEESKTAVTGRKAPWTKPDVQRIAAADAEGAGGAGGDNVVFS